MGSIGPDTTLKYDQVQNANFTNVGGEVGTKGN